MLNGVLNATAPYFSPLFDDFVLLILSRFPETNEHFFTSIAVTPSARILPLSAGEMVSSSRVPRSSCTSSLDREIFGVTNRVSSFPSHFMHRLRSDQSGSTIDFRPNICKIIQNPLCPVSIVQALHSTLQTRIETLAFVQASTLVRPATGGLLGFVERTVIPHFQCTLRQIRVEQSTEQSHGLIIGGASSKSTSFK